ncbi:hypothetical protein M5K25_022138 [Dendrobium thyrsiflorum]|uniref:Uncharacterized protein n=1 Tax=Dendrobium thyrsiflorum TaxID=117978 RepID=A0ABD0UBW5_DENTH
MTQLKRSKGTEKASSSNKIELLTTKTLALSKPKLHNLSASYANLRPSSSRNCRALADEDLEQTEERSRGFTKIDDYPMFRKQIQTLDESAESLRERCLNIYKGCRKYAEGLGEGYDGDIAFASSLEIFGGGHNDPISVAF